MISRTRTTAALLAAAALAACSEQPSTATSGRSVAINAAAAEGAAVYLVTFRDDVADIRGTAAELARGRGFTLRHVRESAARGFSAVLPAHVAQALHDDPRVLLVEKDGPVSLIEPIRVAAGRPGSGTGQTVPYGIARVGGSSDGTGKTAWIIDTGIDLVHADLNTSRACHVDFVRAANGGQDGNGHGTHVAGTIAAKNNTIDVVGVAANAYVCAVRVLNNAGSGTWENVIKGINYVAANGTSGDAANMSLGGSGSNATLEKAVSDAAQKGIRFALAAGNDGMDANGFTPARVNGTNIYTVSAIDSKDCMPSWSNWGNPPVDFAAPGVSIVSTKKGGGTTTMSGTSMAAPHVAGLLLFAAPRADGSACNDPDGNPDPIAHR